MNCCYDNKKISLNGNENAEMVKGKADENLKLLF